jgi:16S rRNA (cytosine1402-N4)-methyltransferase
MLLHSLKGKAMAKEKNKTQSGQVQSGTDSEKDYHISVLLHECIEGLDIKPSGIYVDATLGGGGHSKAILEKLGKKGKLIVFDRDEDALKNAPAGNRVETVHADFVEMKRFLRLHNCPAVDGILADLGVSSHQFDSAERGFSYRFDGPLDMRMNRNAKKTAADVVNGYSAEELQKIFSEYGEVRNAKTLANAIVQSRGKGLSTTADLQALVMQHRIGEEHKYLAQVFQAIRIEVNDELGALREFLSQTADVLKRGGRLVIITFHSLEDRLVKNYMKHGTFEDEPLKDFYGRTDLKFKLVNKKPITASTEELKHNVRARSAKLRIAERI